MFYKKLAPGVGICHTLCSLVPEKRHKPVFTNTGFHWIGFLNNKTPCNKHRFVLFTLFHTLYKKPATSSIFVFKSDAQLQQKWSNPIEKKYN